MIKNENTMNFDLAQRTDHISQAKTASTGFSLMTKYSEIANSVRRTVNGAFNTNYDELSPQQDTSQLLSTVGKVALDNNKKVLGLFAMAFGGTLYNASELPQAIANLSAGAIPLRDQAIKSLAEGSPWLDQVSAHVLNADVASGVMVGVAALGVLQTSLHLAKKAKDRGFYEEKAAKSGFASQRGRDEASFAIDTFRSLGFWDQLRSVTSSTALKSQKAQAKLYKVANKALVENTWASRVVHALVGESNAMALGGFLAERVGQIEELKEDVFTDLTKIIQQKTQGEAVTRDDKKKIVDESIKQAYGEFLTQQIFFNVKRAALSFLVAPSGEKNNIKALEFLRSTAELSTMVDADKLGKYSLLPFLTPKIETHYRENATLNRADFDQIKNEAFNACVAHYQKKDPLLSEQQIRRKVGVVLFDRSTAPDFRGIAVSRLTDLVGSKLNEAKRQEQDIYDQRESGDLLTRNHDEPLAKSVLDIKQRHMQRPNKANKARPTIYFDKEAGKFAGAIKRTPRGTRP
jgi:hypothetical protein